MSRFTLEARTVDSQTDKTPTQIAKHGQPEFDQFPYGWRYVTQILPNGEQTYRQIPLTAEDLLDPQLGDQVVQNSKHQRSNNEIFDMLDNHYDDDPTIEVFNDLKMMWGISGLKEPAPDIAVVPNIKNKGASRSSFEVVKEGTSPCLVIEMMSEGYPGDDTEKINIYERAGVKEYFIINPHSTAPEPFYEMWGYRLISEGGFNKYQRLKPNKQGRLLSETTQIWFGIYKKGQRLKLRDASTGKWLLTASGEKAVRLNEAKARQKAEAKMQAEAKARQNEAKARQKAEAKMQAEAKARQNEAKARQKAEAKMQAETKARQKAETKMQAEAKARQKAETRAQWLEQRLRELEAKS
jgi:Uma2 family endonuclease